MITDLPYSRLRGDDRLRAIVTCRQNGLTWKQIAALFGYATGGSARTTTEAALHRRGLRLHTKHTSWSVLEDATTGDGQE